DAEGKFAINDVCTGTAYSLTIMDDTWWAPELGEIADGGIQGLTIEAWRNGTGGGLFHLAGNEFQSVRTSADVKSDPIMESDTKVRYPNTVPKQVTRIAVGEYLVIVSPESIENLEIFPLIKSGERHFGDAESTVTMDPWSYVGIRFTDDTTFEEVSAVIDQSKVTEKQAGDRAGRYIAGDALPAGRYAILAPKGRSITIVDFGAEVAEAEVAEPEPEAEADAE
ncbi:MAG: hypothetical protein GWP91_04770, partial [Rhodobacterales bacterium]|nr:hypothetical protein [Rhodobacterales bacterium]